MLPGAGRALILLIIISAVVTAARKDVPYSLPRGPSRELGARPGQPHISGDGKKTLKTTLDNNLGLRKTDGHHGNRLPVNARNGHPAAKQHGGSGKAVEDRNQPGPIRATPHTYPTGAPDYESNRPRKTDPRSAEATQNSSRAATNRHPASLLHHVSAFRRDPAVACVTDCHGERDEREAYCHSDFAINGIVHDVDAIGAGVRLLSVLVNSGGFYKMNRLYISPDHGFYRVSVLVVDAPHCPQPCLLLGGRYIMMGQIYQRSLELPSSVRLAVSGRIRAGDALLTSGRSFIRRFNRKKERQVLAAAQARCH